MEVESVYEDGEEEGLFVREAVGSLRIMYLCISTVSLGGLAGTAYGWAAIWRLYVEEWSGFVPANEEGVGDNVVDVSRSSKTP